MTIELKECVRLSARITEASCAKNRASGRIFNCTGCPGLGAASVVDIKEADMAKVYRGVCPLCKREDVLLISKNGECHRCYKRTSMGQDPLSEKRDMPKASNKVVKVKAAPVDDDIDSCDACGTYPCGCFDEGQDATANYERLQKVIEAEKCAAAVTKRTDPAVSSAEVVLCDMGLELDKLFKAKRQEWLAELHAATGIRQTAMRFLDMADAIERLEY